MANCDVFFFVQVQGWVLKAETFGEKHTPTTCNAHTQKEEETIRGLTEVVVLVKEGDAILVLVRVKVGLHVGDLYVGLSTGMMTAHH